MAGLFLFGAGYSSCIKNTSISSGRNWHDTVKEEIGKVMLHYTCFKLSAQGNMSSLGKVSSSFVMRNIEENNNPLHLTIVVYRESVQSLKGPVIRF